MNRAQGNYRSKPDGYLHLQNYSVTKASGMAGALYNHILTSRQADIVENALLERSQKLDAMHPDKPPSAIFKHECWRFDKAFLKQHFKPVVYGVFRLIRRNASEQMAIAINREYLQTEATKVRWS